ncbi:RagB/SusD family nutrient uptake outer membrane protein [Geofilum rubicundum]|uniref:SusD-like N-terminal domain-containing protein n=1 Tax=Geofilum rubicundum JCM 15548 TaxID=1236989 RepID=A0A0E9LUN5_9BACT|nr:RagB/SusD family nutrient uptake outer membrane protein [Geofilum rubicundum]GAO28856.1 hypothetical protein JCM15548_1991 [Geofilum rubicundum JCM 15548]
MKNRIKLSIIALFTLALVFNSGCEDLFEPAIENHKVDEDLRDMPAWALGLLGHAYISNPVGTWSFNDVATDDAVSNFPGNAYRLMSTGAWSANFNPTDRWHYLRASWQYLNQFLVVADEITWAADPVVAEMFRERFKGDAYGMRALYMYHLLLHHAGPSEVDGQMLGIPIITEPEDLYNSEFNLPRNTFQECLNQLFADVDSAIKLLPDNFGDVDRDELIPEKYRELGITSGQFTRVFGDNVKNRMSAQIARLCGPRLHCWLPVLPTPEDRILAGRMPPTIWGRSLSMVWEAIPLVRWTRQVMCGMQITQLFRICLPEIIPRKFFGEGIRRAMWISKGKTIRLLYMETEGLTQLRTW